MLYARHHGCGEGMRTFTLQLQDAARIEKFGDVTSFVGEDATGSFGLLAGHGRFMTALTIGLARFRSGAGGASGEGGEQPWQYLAVPGALLLFHEDVLTLSTRHYLLDADFTRISRELQQQLLVEEEQLHAMKESLHQMEEEVLKRLWEISRRQNR